MISNRGPGVSAYLRAPSALWVLSKLIGPELAPLSVIVWIVPRQDQSAALKYLASAPQYRQPPPVRSMWHDLRLSGPLRWHMDILNPSPALFALCSQASHFLSLNLPTAEAGGFQEGSRDMARPFVIRGTFHAQQKGVYGSVNISVVGRSTRLAYPVPH